MDRIELPLMAALLASLAVFLFTKTLVVFAVVLLCASAIGAIAVLRVVRG